MSLLFITENITITGNTFIGGGRGCWVNQPYNVIISDNIFIRNTQKCTSDIHTGRICQATVVSKSQSSFAVINKSGNYKKKRRIAKYGSYYAWN